MNIVAGFPRDFDELDENDSAFCGLVFQVANNNFFQIPMVLHVPYWVRHLSFLVNVVCPDFANRSFLSEPNPVNDGQPYIE